MQRREPRRGGGGGAPGTDSSQEQRPDERRARRHRQVVVGEHRHHALPLREQLDERRRDGDGEQRHHRRLRRQRRVPEGMVHGDDAERGRPRADDEGAGALGPLARASRDSLVECASSTAHLGRKSACYDRGDSDGVQKDGALNYDSYPHEKVTVSELPIGCQVQFHVILRFRFGLNVFQHDGVLCPEDGPIKLPVPQHVLEGELSQAVLAAPIVFSHQPAPDLPW